MKYFSKLFNNVEYDFGLNVPVVIKNIFRQYDIDISNPEIIKLEHIYANETLHEISYKLYGTIDYWWVLALLNGIKDWFDVYYNDNLFMAKAKKLAQQYFDDNKITDYTQEQFYEKYLEFYEQLKNNQQYTIMVINPEYMTDALIKIFETIKAGS